MSEKVNEKNGPKPKTGKNGSYQKVDNKPEKKRDLSKLHHFGKKMFVGRVANLEMQMSTMDVKVRFIKNLLL